MMKETKCVWTVLILNSGLLIISVEIFIYLLFINKYYFLVFLLMEK